MNFFESVLACIIFLTVPFLIYYILYKNGNVWRNCYAGRGSNLFIIKNFKNGFMIKSTLCTTKRKKIIRFNESTAYNFELDIENKSGNIEFDFLDDKNNKIFHLDSDNFKVENIVIGLHKKYYIVQTANSFKGNTVLKWDKL